MKRFALLLASATAFVSPALAADVIYDEPPAPAPMVEAAPQYNWSGLYVGGQAGVAFNRDSGAFSSDTTGFSGGNDDSNSGFIGGGHIGYDYQMGNFVIGAVADLNYIDAEANTSYTLPTATGTQTFGADQEINYVGTVRAKAGYAMDRFMVYATGGLAYADIENSYNGGGTYTDGLGNAYDVSARTDNDDIGYAVGGGFDVLATQNVSFGLEYLYTDLGESSVDVDYTPVAGGLGGASFSTDSNNDLTYHSVMAKASYRFN
ncbi:outer membrane beta-barrel protein [Aureimonas sp. SA4125]|uniref:outer membrane protein n=1 Tax=Aureimonas sp. SA4125 TaxID=2826993 RepID=UPI001CC3472E|nr:outer membrane beta-barrel protein [Aureimonas sp. SA4125]